MSNVIKYERFWQRRDTAANWSSVNPIMAAGEFGVVTDAAASSSERLKLGDGVTTWNDLPFLHAELDAMAAGDNIVIIDGVIHALDPLATYLVDPDGNYLTDPDGNLLISGGPSTTNLPEGTNLYFTEARAKAAAVSNTITDGVPDVAPSQEAVHAALALKRDDATVYAAATPSVNQALDNATTTKVTLGTEVSDSHGYFDPATGRFTPLTAGLYQVIATASFVVAGAGTAGERIIAYVYKNGVQDLAVTSSTHTTATNNIQAVALVQMNGTTDYIEMYMRRDTTAAYSINSAGTRLSVMRVGA